MTCRVEILDEISALEEVEREWTTLWRAVEGATPFQHPGWLLAWWRVFHPGRLFCVAVRMDGRLTGIVPLYLDHGGIEPRLLPVGISLSDRIDALICADERQRTLAAIAETLARSADWLELCLPDLSPHSLLPAIALPSAARTLTRGTACPVLAVRGEDGLASVPSIKRRKLRMSRNRIAREVGSRVVDMDEMSVEVLWGHLRGLHGARWRERGEDGVLADAETAAFQLTALRAMSDCKLARWYALEVDCRVVGAYYGFEHGQRAYAYIGGFDPKAAYFSPGTLLIGHVLSHAARAGVRELDFLRGAEPYKYEWGAENQSNSVLMYRRTI